MSLSEKLTAGVGAYFGDGDGLESGPFVSRLAISLLPHAGVAIDYEATSIEEGVQHIEHTLLVPGPDQRDRLYVAHSESPFVTILVETAPESGRFEQPVANGPFAMAIVIDLPEPGRITYAWWWAMAGEQPIEQSKADARILVRP
jgi:hypothetical protein